MTLSAKKRYKRRGNFSRVRLILNSTQVCFQNMAVRIDLNIKLKLNNLCPS